MSSSNNSSSSSSGSGSSFIPNYREEDFLNNLAKAAQDLMDAQRQWGLQEYGKNSQITDKVVNDALATNQFMSGSARADLERYQKLFQPLENQLLSQASSYASPARMRAEIGAGKAGAAQSMAAQRRNAEKALAGYGINPSSGRYAALDKASRIQQGAAEAAAGQAARRATEATARSLRSEGLQIGGQYPTRIAGQVNQALQASTTGINSALANTQVGINALGSPQTWAQIANALKYPPLGSQHTSQSSSRGSGGSQQAPHAIPAQHPDDKKGGGSGSGKNNDGIANDKGGGTDSREADRAEREAEKAADRASREAIAGMKHEDKKPGGGGGKSPGKQGHGGGDQEGKEEERAAKALQGALAAQNKAGGGGGAGITNIPPKRGDIGAGAKEGGRGSMGEALKDWERGEKNQEDEVDKWLRESGVDPLTGEPIERDQQNMPLEGDMRELPGEDRFKYGDDTPPGPKGDEEMTNPPVEQNPWDQPGTGANTNEDPNAPENVGWGEQRDPYDPFTGSGGATDEPTFPPELTGQDLTSDIGAGETEEGADPFGRYGYQNDPYAESDDEQSINDLGPYYNPGDEFESWGAEGDGTIYGMEEGDVLDSWGAEGEDSPYETFGQDGGSAYDYAQAGDWGYGDESAYDGFDPNSGDGFDYASAGDWGYGDESPYDGYDAGYDNFDYDNNYADNDFNDGYDNYDTGYDNFDYDNEYADNDFGYEDYDSNYNDNDFGYDDGSDDWGGYDDYDYGNDDYGSDDYGGYDDYDYGGDDYDNYDDYGDDDYGGYDDDDYGDYGGYDDYDDYAQGGQVRGRNPALALGGPTTGGAVSRNASPSGGQQVDDIPARLNAGEFVIPRDVAHYKGREFFENLIKKSRTARGAPQQPTGATMAPAGPAQQPRFRSRPMGR